MYIFKKQSPDYFKRMIFMYSINLLFLLDYSNIYKYEYLYILKKIYIQYILKNKPFEYFSMNGSYLFPKSIKITDRLLEMIVILISRLKKRKCFVRFL